MDFSLWFETLEVENVLQQVEAKLPPPALLETLFSFWTARETLKV